MYPKRVYNFHPIILKSKNFSFMKKVAYVLCSLLFLACTSEKKKENEAIKPNIVFTFIGWTK